MAAEESGALAVRLIEAPIRPSEIITTASVENAIRVLMAISGSTNAVVHLAAIAGRLGIKISQERFNQISDETPVLVDLKPVGDGYMEDFFAAGGVGAVLRELKPLLNLDAINVLGQTLEARLEAPLDWVDRRVIRTIDNPVSPVGGLIVLDGTLAPMAPCLNAQQPRRNCLKLKAGLSCSTGLRISAIGSMILISMSRRRIFWC